jgi:DNA-binding NtrC family response regulator
MDRRAKILIIDDEETICFAFRRFLEARGFQVEIASTGAAGLAAYADQPAEVVFLDVRLPDSSGLDVLKQLCAGDPEARVIIMTAHGSLEVVSQALRGSAFDYLVKPIDLPQAGGLVEQALASRQAAVESPAPAASEPADEKTFVGRSAAIQEVYKRICRVADSDSSALILGETGTGKELAARTIHRQSRRSAGPFVVVNCGALPENLVESELFGYARGAFTGANGEKPGRFELADGGTLFFDEVGELPLAAQVKLLRFLDSQTVERLGSVESLRLNVRILAATNRDLEAAVAAGQFRPDLYYRLAVIQVRLPPLAERPEDILPLAGHFLALRTLPGSAPQALSREAAQMLQNYAWPGNVRELRNVIEHAAVVAGGGPILPAHLPDPLQEAALRPAADTMTGLDRTFEEYAATLSGNIPYRDAVKRLEKALIQRALAECGGNQSAAADLLGLHRNTLRHKLRDLGLES